MNATGADLAASEGERPEPPDSSHRSNDFPIGVWILAPVLVVLVPPLLRQWSILDFAFRPALFVSMTVIVAIFTVVTWALLHFLAFSRDMRRSAGVASVIVAAVFLWTLWTTMGEFTAHVTRIGLLSEIIPVLAFAGLLWVAVRFANHDRFIFIFVGLLVGLIIFFAFTMTPRVVGATGVSFPVSEHGPKPNVIVLVLDGYARADVLASQYGFENSAFLDALTERGFQVRDDALANYSVTHASLPSMMVLDYPFEEEMRSDAARDRMRRLLSGDGALVHTFESAGYETLMFENAWSGSNCGGVPDRCHRTGLLSRSLWELGQISPLATIQRTTVPHPFTAVGLQHIRELGDVIGDDESGPLFTFAHVTVPHPPTQLDSSCDFVVGSDRLAMSLALAGETEGERSEARGRYVNQLQCINREVIASVDSLLAADENIEIVIVADHGPGSQYQTSKEAVDWTDDELIERLSVLSAVRMPSRCAEREPARTTVNTIRRAVACALGADIPDLPDRSFVVREGKDIHEPIVDVTDRMDSISGASNL